MQDVLASSKFIVVTYFDESACTSPGIEGNGVAIFDLKGSFLFGYTSLFGDDAADVCDCYAACLTGESSLLFFPYTDFPLVLFDLESKQQTVWDVPSELAGSGAITSVRDQVYFHSPYKDDDGIYKWQIGSKAASRVGSHEGMLRGLTEGRFLVVGKEDYTIISMLES